MSAFYLVGFENALVNQSISWAFVNATNIILLESYRRTLARLAYLEARKISRLNILSFLLKIRGVLIFRNFKFTYNSLKMFQNQLR